MYAWFQSISSMLLISLDGLFRVTNDWGLAIVGLTLCVKLCLFYFNLLAARQQLLGSIIQPKLKEIREIHGNTRDKLTEETKRLYRKSGVRPVQSFVVILLQMPFLIGMYGLFQTHGNEMSSILVPWLNSLGKADPTHVIPICTVILISVTGMIPLTTYSFAGSIGIKRIIFTILLAILILTFMWNSSVALGLYWITSTSFGLLERGFYRTVWGKKLLGSNKIALKISLI